MTPQELLRYQLLLLMAAYGREKVLAALASILTVSEQDLRTTLDDIQKMKPAAKRKSKAQNQEETIEQLIAENPERGDMLRILVARFNRKAFLPELKDVNRFLERRSSGARPQKSRAAGLPAVIKSLLQIDTNELAALCEQPDVDGYSALGIISDEILGTRKEGR